MRVAENRAARGGRTIGLHIVVLPASEGGRQEPLFALQGGPGQAATRLAGFYADVFSDVRRERDIVLVDQRGTGESNPMNCELGSGSTSLFPLAAVGACRDRLTPVADPRFYTTVEAVADLDAVRRALGYGKINLVGTSLERVWRSSSCDDIPIASDRSSSRVWSHPSSGTPSSRPATRR